MLAHALIGELEVSAGNSVRLVDELERTRGRAGSVELGGVRLELGELASPEVVEALGGVDGLVEALGGVDGLLGPRVAGYLFGHFVPFMII